MEYELPTIATIPDDVLLRDLDIMKRMKAHYKAMTPQDDCLLCIEHVDDCYTCPWYIMTQDSCIADMGSPTGVRMNPSRWPVRTVARIKQLSSWILAYETERAGRVTLNNTD